MYHSGEKIPFMMLVSARPEKGPLQNIYFDLTAAYRAVEGTVEQEEQAEGGAAADKPFSAGMLIGYPRAQRRLRRAGRNRRVPAVAEPIPRSRRTG